MIRLALVSLNQTSSDPPLGLAYLASYLRKNMEIDVVIVDKEDLLAGTVRSKPDAVGISAMSTEYPVARSLARALRQELEVPLMLGGHHITAMPSHVVDFDVGIIGEGEQTLLEVMCLIEMDGGLSQDKLKLIKGVAGHGFVTERRGLIDPIDAIPYPARDLLRMKDVYLVPRRLDFSKFSVGTTLFTSRGCPYDCTFCSSWCFWGRKIRFHSAGYVVGEIKELVDRWHVKEFLIYDDLFAMNLKRLEDIVNKLGEEGLRGEVEFLALGRANLINDKVCDLLKRMGVRTMGFGLESGSEKTLSFLKGKSVTVKQNWDAVRLCKKYGFNVTGSFIIGNPGETEEDLEQTYKLMASPYIDFIELNQLTPLPATELWDFAKSKGLVDDSPDFDYTKLFVTHFKSDFYLGDLDIKTYHKWFEKLEVLKRQKNYRRLTINLAFLKWIFNPAFIKKAMRHLNEIPTYIRNVFRH
ncbi:MAG: B12-binding domain-containing radical SAM protein [Candidatus Verstraetearchaeota archaeon]|nr:B12-binding domain-containing radical SAM protein [Candidatus Verstraetearchaeota archaeon]